MKAYPEPPISEAFAISHARFGEVVAVMANAQTQSLQHAELEELVQREGRELMRLLLQDHLELRASHERQMELRDEEGRVLGEVRSRTRSLMTIVGPVDIRRLGYSRRGVASVFPADEALNLPVELYSHGMRRRVGEEAAKNSYDEVVQSIETGTGGTVPKRQAEELVRRLARDFDGFYAERMVCENAWMGDFVIISLDGKGVVVRPQDLREVTRKRAANDRHKLACRLSGGEKRNRKRMATVASVYEIAPHPRTAEDIMEKKVRAAAARPPLARNKRVWAGLLRSPDEVTHDAFDEAHRRDPEHRCHWVVLVDGERDQLRRVHRIVRERGLRVTIVLDLIHVLERLWNAAWVFFDKGDPAVERWVAERAIRVLRGESSGVAAGIRRSATRRGLAARMRHEADASADYLLANRDLLRYDRYLREGLPIATGVIEGACRHLIKDRMDITGARWSLDGAEAVLRIRSLRASADFEQYWRFHQAAEQARSYGCAA
jgi:hypothetical protein